MAKKTPIILRAEPAQHALLTKVAKMLHKARSAFILEAACREAEAILLDQRFFQLDDKRFNDFDRKLAEPAKSSNQLKKLLKHQSPWE